MSKDLQSRYDSAAIVVEVTSGYAENETREVSFATVMLWMKQNHELAAAMADLAQVSAVPPRGRMLRVPPRDVEKLGYEPDKVPLNGASKVYPQHCSIETYRECGCGIGQCARGLIF